MPPASVQLSHVLVGDLMAGREAIHRAEAGDVFCSQFLARHLHFCPI